MNRAERGLCFNTFFFCFSYSQFDYLFFLSHTVSIPEYVLFLHLVINAQPQCQKTTWKIVQAVTTFWIFKDSLTIDNFIIAVAVFNLWLHCACANQKLNMGISTSQLDESEVDTYTSSTGCMLASSFAMIYFFRKKLLNIYP